MGAARYPHQRPNRGYWSVTVQNPHSVMSPDGVFAGQGAITVRGAYPSTGKPDIHSETRALMHGGCMAMQSPTVTPGGAG
jgi:hypothetical protein